MPDRHISGTLSNLIKIVKPIIIENKIKSFSKVINVDSDKSISIRWVLFASQAVGKSTAYNLLMSEDVLSALACLKKLGIKVILNKNKCEIYGNGINGFNYKKNIILNAGNSGTLGRLILPLLLKSPVKVKLLGDKSLSKRDFSRIISPLEQFGAEFFPKNKKNIPLQIKGSNFIRPINYLENKGSAQCKSAVMLGAIHAPGITKIKAKKSRNHTENFFKNLNIPIKIKKNNKYDLIEVYGEKNFKSFNYKIPGDISSSAFFIVLTILLKNSNLIIKKINVNPTRDGIIRILRKMGAKIFYKNVQIYKGEKIADIHVKSSKVIKPINCPPSLNSAAIDEFLIIFLVAAKAKGVSYFKNIEELNEKESKRLNLGSKILNLMGVKTQLTKSSIKIYGQPNLQIKKKCVIKNFLGDHRIMAMCTIAGLSIGGKWEIHNPESINTSFPSFFKILKNKLGAEIN
tara:strand:+ start:5011 stop:6387 length:1377 start_codon:yes stop_codon:yes gene_type:complete